MKEWLRDRRLTLWVVGIVVPLLTVLCFWSTIRPDWPFWLACYIFGLPAGIAVIWTRHRGRESWSQLERRRRILLRCFTVVTVWSLVFLQSSDRASRVFTATVLTIVLLLFWASYILFSLVIERIWSRIRAR